MFLERQVVSRQRYYSQKKSLKSGHWEKRFSCLLQDKHGNLELNFNTLSKSKNTMSSSSLHDKKKLSLQCEIARLRPILDALKACATLEEKVQVLGLSEVSVEALVKESLRLIGQEESSIQDLIVIEKFYSEMGGVLGYHSMMLSQILSQDEKEEGSGTTYHLPEWVDIGEETEAVRALVVEGIRQLPQMAEIYPVGGAADRLRLQDEKTGEFLPAAQLVFGGRTLLESMVLDLSAREYVYYKLFGKEVATPIAMMTSLEKENHAHILSICEKMNWFGRPKELFRFFCQPSVPTMNTEGAWCKKNARELLMKPGGHGVIWKLARDEKIFEWLFSLQRSKALVRQINNPIAGIDYGLSAFLGIGCSLNKSFGFGSCPRHLRAAEGMNILKRENGKEVLTNVEYCHFQKVSIEESEKFPANTNLLFVDLKAADKAASLHPIPGVLVNVKKIRFYNEKNELCEEEVARLESTMQNLADYFPAEETFISLNKRHKTISAIKREFTMGASLLETPEGCYLDLQKNARELLTQHCGFTVPEIYEDARLFTEGPSFIFRYHPSLGPYYSVIAQKIRRGRLNWGSEVQLEIAELDIQDLDVEGSLIVRAKAPMGHFDEEGRLRYSERAGKCILKNVAVRNLGIDREVPNVFWKSEIARKEACEVQIQGDGEFYAENVTFRGTFCIVVPAGTKVTAKEQDGSVVLEHEPIHAPSWVWSYAIDASCRLICKKNGEPF